MIPGNSTQFLEEVSIEELKNEYHMFPAMQYENKN